MNFPAHESIGEPRVLRMVSVVAPVYNEDATIDEFHARVCAALDGIPFELVLVEMSDPPEVYHSIKTLQVRAWTAVRKEATAS